MRAIDRYLAKHPYSPLGRCFVSAERQVSGGNVSTPAMHRADAFIYLRLASNWRRVLAVSTAVEAPRFRRLFRADMWRARCNDRTARACGLRLPA